MVVEAGVVVAGGVGGDVVPCVEGVLDEAPLNGDAFGFGPLGEVGDRVGLAGLVVGIELPGEAGRTGGIVVVMVAVEISKCQRSKETSYGRLRRGRLCCRVKSHAKLPTATRLTCAGGCSRLSGLRLDTVAANRDRAYTPGHSWHKIP